MLVTARFVCRSVTEFAPYGDTVNFEVRMEPITSGHPEENNYSKYTPSGDFRIIVTNPDLKGHFKPGEIYDFKITHHPTTP